MDAEKKLRSDKLLLRRALLAEKETVAALQREAQARAAERMELMQRADALAAEKTRLAAAVTQLKQEIAAERQAASASITGGSMFNTLLSSADGSTAEIDRLRAQIKLMEEELASQIKNTGKVHDEMHRQKRAHEYEVQKLRAETAKAVEDAEQARERSDTAAANLDFARRQATELRTQLDAKSGLAAELSRKLEAKAAALQRLERLRESDLEAMRQRFAQKVPFDDSADADVAARFALRPALVVRNRMRVERASGIHARMQRLSSVALGLLANLKRGSASDEESSAVAALCGLMQGCVATLAGGAQISEKDAQGLCAALAGACAALSAAPSLRDSPLASALGSLGHMAKQTAGATSIPTDEDTVRLLAEAGTRLRKAEHSEHDLGGLGGLISDALRVAGEAATEVAQLLQEQRVRSRALEGADPRTSVAATQWKALRAAGRSAATGSRRASEAMAQKCAAQAARLAKLEAQYQALRAELTQKEKLLEQRVDEPSSRPLAGGAERAVQDLSAGNTSETAVTAAPRTIGGDTDEACDLRSEADGASHDGLFEVVVVDEATGDLSTNLGEVILRQTLGAQSSWVERTRDEIRALEEQAHSADAKAAAVYQKYLEAVERAKALESERAAHEASRQRFAQELRAAKISWQEEVQHTKSSYDAQLQHLTSEMMRLQDVEQEYETEIARLKAEIGGIKAAPKPRSNPFLDDAEDDGDADLNVEL